MGNQFEQFITNFSDLRSKPAFELFSGRAQSEIGLRADQIDDCLRLSEVHFAVEKGALCEFARTRRPRTRPQAHFKDSRGNQHSAVTTDLNQILSGITGWRVKNGQHYFISQSTVLSKNPAKSLHARLELRWHLFAMEDFVRYADRIRARDPDKRNSAFPGRSRDGSDGVRNCHNPGKL